MKILFLTNKFIFPAKDGYAVAVFNMVRAFARAGHSVSVLSMNTPRHYGELESLPDPVKQLASWFAVDVDTDIKPMKLLGNWFLSSRSYHVERFTSEDFRRELALLFSQTTFDVVQLEGLYLAPYIGTIRQHAPRAKIIFRAHNLENEIWVRTAANEPNPLKKVYFTMTAERLLAYEQRQMSGMGCDAIVPITDRDAGAIRKMGAKVPVFTSSAGYDLAFLEALPLSPEWPSVFYIGALDWRPNQEGMRWFLKEVWNKIHAAYPHVPLYLAGRNMPEEFRMLDGLRNIRVLGEVEDAYAYMRERSIMVVPLLAGGGMRIKLIEGMALGKAIVATKTAAEGIPAKHGAHMLLTNDTDAGAFFNGVASLIESKELAEMLGKNAAALSKSLYDSKVLTEKLVKFYDSLPSKQERP